MIFICVGLESALAPQTKVFATLCSYHFHNVVHPCSGHPVHILYLWRLHKQIWQSGHLGQHATRLARIVETCSGLDSSWDISCTCSYCCQHAHVLSPSPFPSPSRCGSQCLCPSPYMYVNRNRKYSGCTIHANCICHVNLT